ncbi:cell division protein ZapB [Aeromonas hydrophila]|nr:cell division protein ZapB [Aeromonas hydrophila]RCF43619.1 cell division protein ZapB [Aeromonas hydrophila]
MCGAGRGLGAGCEKNRRIFRQYIHGRRILQRTGLFVPIGSGYAGFTRLNRPLWGIAIEHTGMHMSLEVLEQLESKVQSAVDNISLLKMELDELKEQNNKLQDENHQLRNEHVAWQERLRALLGKMDQMGESI